MREEAGEESPPGSVQSSGGQAEGGKVEAKVESGKVEAKVESSSDDDREEREDEVSGDQPGGPEGPHDCRQGEACIGSIIQNVDTFHYRAHTDSFYYSDEWSSQGDICCVQRDDEVFFLEQ